VLPMRPGSKPDRGSPERTIWSGPRESNPSLGVGNALMLPAHPARSFTLRHPSVFKDAPGLYGPGRLHPPADSRWIQYHRATMAGQEGFEPSTLVLETNMIAISPLARAIPCRTAPGLTTPYQTMPRCASPNNGRQSYSVDTRACQQLLF
jgi:hypothetical protein